MAIPLGVFAIAEFLIVFGLNHPPPWLWARRLLAGYYYDFDRSIVQMMPECARYDGELGYTLRPGRCRFRNREFDTEIRVNSAGLRDSEDALIAPQMIVVGDSFAMGWGVEVEATFAKRLDRMCSMKTLIAAISSYGTAREARLLERLDRSKLAWLIVQYNANDLSENRRFRAAGDRLSPMSEAQYLELQRGLERRAAYYPGKHVGQFAMHLARRIRARLARSLPVSQVESALAGNVAELSDAAEFAHALSTVSGLPSGAGIVVLELNGSMQNDGAFAERLRTELAREVYPAWVRSARVLDPSPMMGLDKFFALDEHLSAEGHRAVAELIGRNIGCPASGDAEGVGR